MQMCELSIDREIQFLLKYQLTPDELFVIKLIFLSQDGRDDYLTGFFSECTERIKLRDILVSLQEKEIINKSYKVPEEGTIFNPQDVDFNKRVVNSFMQHSQDIGMELFEKYPPMITINSKTYSLRNISKNFKSFDDYCFEYGKTIKWDLETHKHIIELLEYGKENNLIKSGICDFIISRQWTTLEMMRDGDMGTFETNELI